MAGGLGEMLAGGPEGLGLPPQEEGEMGPAPRGEGGQMSPDEAMATLQRFRIGPDDFPEVAMAVMAIIEASAGSGGEEEMPPEMPPEEGPPPGAPPM